MEVAKATEKPQLQGAVYLAQRGCAIRGFTENEGRKSDVKKRPNDQKMEGEKEALVHRQLKNI